MKTLRISRISADRESFSLLRERARSFFRRSWSDDQGHTPARAGPG